MTKIRKRHRVQACRPTGLKPEWTEYQCVSARKIVGSDMSLRQLRKDFPDAERDASVTLNEWEQNTP